MSEPKVSIIIPVYNAERYLSRCVESVLGQSMQDFELILVNDGSKDSSGQICRSFASADNRIRVIEIENSGPARARNVGIDAANGEFLSFVDADDSVQPNFLESLLEAAEKDNLDMVMCRVLNVHVNGSSFVAHTDLPLNKVLLEDGIKHEIFPAYFIAGKGEGLSSMCNKLIRKSWLNSIGIRIDEKRVRAEDWLFNLQCFLAYPKFIVINEALYNYHQNEGSVMHTLRDGEWWQSFDSMNILLDVNKKIGGDYQEDIAICTFLSAAEFTFRLKHEGRDAECNELLRSKEMRNVVNMISFSKLFGLPKAFTAMGLTLKINMPRLAKLIINRF